MIGQSSLRIRASIKNLALTAGLQWGILTNVAGFAAATPVLPAGPQLLQVFTLPRTSLETFAPTNHHYDLQAAQKAGLKFVDLPSIGSGLARRADGALFGITDRGPNGENEKQERVFPLPDFCPAIVQLELTNQTIRILRVLPLTGTNGKSLSGLSNGKSEEPGFSSPGENHLLATDPGGVDPESIRCLPDGRFVLGPEKVALSNDNDFGIGENPNGEPSKVWVLRLPALRHFLQ